MKIGETKPDVFLDAPLTVEGLIEGLRELPPQTRVLVAHKDRVGNPLDVRVHRMSPYNGAWHPDPATDFRVLVIR